MFQFPSNGKAYPKELHLLLLRGDWRGFNSLQTGKPIQSSFPPRIKRRYQRFNSLQTGKPIQSQSVCYKPFWTSRFNSLQTGKPIQSKEVENARDNLLDRFQFPSNGKAYPKRYIKLSMIQKALSFNSLQTGKPIQRYSTNSETVSQTMSFNSLQTGKPIQRTFVVTRKEWINRFQFPSNGKAYPKTDADTWIKRC